MLQTVRGLKWAGYSLLLALALALAGCGGGSSGTGGSGVVQAGAELLKRVPFAPTPDPDAFYAQPEPFPVDAPPGTLLNSRRITFRPGLSVPMANAAWQLQYVTRDAQGRPIAAVTTVVKPLLPALAFGGRKPVVSYQFAYDSLGAECTPSRTISGGTANANNQLETLSYILGLTAEGWTMVMPDYEGPYSAYGAGEFSGQATLDSIRAALSFEELGLSPDSPVALWGYSGGALATAWAAALHPGYAPELNLVGAASGGTPADVFSVVQAAEGGPFFNLIFSAVVGANRAYPNLLPASIINEAGRAAIEKVRDGCVGGGGVLGIGLGGARLSDYTTHPDPFNSPGALAVKPKVTLPQPGRTPTIDMFIYHEIFDELIPIAGTDKLVEQWCADGAHIRYLRALGGEHITGVVTGAPQALLYVTSRFAGGALDPLATLGSSRCN
ncbi:lipase family protein [Solimonas sp. K1W22B-7]|uniref:lipase family protein n=1 Tax=Solimonas sp. K1W22B-7 TaxID=2303331 RepID=UPI0013C4C932|nr:lipase family protein [Solimonas sp. K1W22B-7]